MSEEPVFKKKIRPGNQFRKRRTDEDDEEEDAQDPQPSMTEGKSVTEVKEMQRNKKRVNRGVNVIDLLERPVQETITKEKKVISGLTSSKALASELDLGNTFSVETNRRDEDAEMAKFIEEELLRRKGFSNQEEEKKGYQAGSSVEDLVFNVIPRHLLAPEGSHKTEEMLSNQMLSGIPEIDLGVDETIRTIEATEEAKKKLLLEKLTKTKSDSGQNLIPNNIAVNFRQANREKVQDLKNKTQQLQKAAASTTVEEPVVRIGQEPTLAPFVQTNPRDKYLKHPGHAKPTDDYHFERFKKNFRR